MTRKQASNSHSSHATPSESGGKVSNDHNKSGSQAPTQKNEAKRTPQSRDDRGAQLGSDNQSRVRRGEPNANKAR